MKNIKLYVASILISASMLNIGCVSTVSDHTRSAYNNVRKALKVKPGSAETDNLYAQVRGEDQRRIDKLTHELEITRQTETLAELERKRDDLQRERSRVNAKRTELLAEETELKIELAKLEAIERNRLGDRVQNIEMIADVHVDALEVQQKRLKLDGEVSILDIKIADAQTEIEKQMVQIKNLKDNDTTSRG